MSKTLSNDVQLIWKVSSLTEAPTCRTLIALLVVSTHEPLYFSAAWWRGSQETSAVDVSSAPANRCWLGFLSAVCIALWNPPRPYLLIQDVYDTRWTLGPSKSRSPPICFFWLSDPLWVSAVRNHACFFFSLLVPQSIDLEPFFKFWFLRWCLGVVWLSGSALCARDQKVVSSNPMLSRIVMLPVDPWVKSLNPWKVFEGGCLNGWPHVVTQSFAFIRRNSWPFVYLFDVVFHCWRTAWILKNRNTETLKIPASLPSPKHLGCIGCILANENNPMSHCIQSSFLRGKLAITLVRNTSTFLAFKNTLGPILTI